MSVIARSKVERASPEAANVSSRIARYAPGSIVAAFVVITLFLAYRLNIWQDEAYSLHTTGSGVFYAWRQGLNFEAQAPLYFVALAVWRFIDMSAFHARLLSVACSLLTLYITWRFARRYIAGVDPSIVLAAVALNPFTIWASVEIRPYAAAVMCSALLLYLFFRGFVDEQPNRNARFAYTLVLIAATYTQYYIAFLLPANFVALVALRRWGSLRLLTIAAIAVAVALVPIAFFLPKQLAAYHAFAVAFALPSYIVVAGVLDYVFPHRWVSSWTHQPLLNAFYLAAVAVPLALAAGYVRRLNYVTKCLLLIVATLAALFTAAIVLGHVQVIVGRHTAVMFVPTAFLVFASIGSVAKSRRPSVLIAYSCFFMVFAAASLWHEYHTMSKSGDWRRVASFIDGNARPTDAVIVFNAEAQLPLGYYLRARDRIEAIPRPLAFDRFDETRFILHDDREARTAFERAAGGASRIWLAESSVCAIRGDFFGCSRLNRFIGSHLRTIRVAKFDGATVFELQKVSDRKRLPTSHYSQ